MELNYRQIVTEQKEEIPGPGIMKCFYYKKTVEVDFVIYRERKVLELTDWLTRISPS